MWKLADLALEIEDVDQDVVMIRISTPVGEVTLLGKVTIAGRSMTIDQAHIDGPGPGALRTAGLRRIADKILEEADVDDIVIQGSTRTTGRNKGKVPKAIRYP